MKKVFALFVLCIFVAGMIPMTFAEDQGPEENKMLKLQVHKITADDNDSDDNNSDDNNSDDNDSDDNDSDDKPKMAEKVIRKEMKLRVRNNNDTESNKSGPAVARARFENAKEKLMLARERYFTAKEKLNTVRQKYQEKKGEFKEKYAEYKKCKDDESEDCDAKRKDMKIGAKKHLSQIADVILAELEKIYAKVESSEDLSDEEKESMLEEIQTRIDEITSAKDTIENISEETSKDEVNEAAKTLKNAWHEIRALVKKHTGKAVNARLGNIIHNTEMLMHRLTKAKENLEKRGVDTSSLHNMLVDFDSYLEVARNKHAEARAILEDLEPGTVDESMKEAKVFFDEAKDALKSAREVLRDIIKEIKGSNNDQLDVIPDEVEDEKETEDETGDNETEVAE